MFLFSGIIILMFLKYNRKKDKDILKIESYMERINADDYSITIDNNMEEELSILKNEVYKTMIKLRENALNQLNDKMSIKTSIEDISHQIKTPLTSIVIAIDTLDDNPDLDLETKERFYKSVNSSSDSVGIGLSLTKAILDNSNASISVDSIKNKTLFKIKYFK